MSTRIKISSRHPVSAWPTTHEREKAGIRVVDEDFPCDYVKRRSSGLGRTFLQRKCLATSLSFSVIKTCHTAAQGATMGWGGVMARWSCPGANEGSPCAIIIWIIQQVLAPFMSEKRHAPALFMSEYAQRTAPFMSETFTKHPSRKKNFQVKIQCCVQSYYTAARSANRWGALWLRRVA